MGKILFIIGIVLAAAMGLFDFNASWVPWLLVILGAVVGFLNITPAETQRFLLAGIAMTLAATAFSQVPLIGAEVTAIMGHIMSFLSGAIFVVAAKSLFETAID